MELGNSRKCVIFWSSLFILCLWDSLSLTSSLLPSGDSRVDHDLNLQCLLSPSITPQIALIKSLILKVTLPCIFINIVAWSEWLVRRPSYQLTWFSVVLRNMVTSPICSLRYPNFHHKLAPSLYECFYNTLTICSTFNVDTIIDMMLRWHSNNMSWNGINITLEHLTSYQY
jgi:hypothetical protein